MARPIFSESLHNPQGFPRWLVSVVPVPAECPREYPQVAPCVCALRCSQEFPRWQAHVHACSQQATLLALRSPQVYPRWLACVVLVPAQCPQEYPKVALHVFALHRP